MTAPTITYRGMPHSPAMDEKIHAYAAKLLEFQPKVTTCHVIVDEADHRKRGQVKRHEDLSGDQTSP